VPLQAHGKIFLDFLSRLAIDEFTFNGDLFNFFKIMNFSMCIEDLVVFVKYKSCTKILKCYSRDEFDLLLKKMETAHCVFIFEQERLCH
jgi:hypothetical protein